MLQSVIRFTDLSFYSKHCCFSPLMITGLPEDIKILGMGVIWTGVVKDGNFFQLNLESDIDSPNCPHSLVRLDLYSC